MPAASCDTVGEGWSAHGGVGWGGVGWGGRVGAWGEGRTVLSMYGTHYTTATTTCEVTPRHT